MLAPHVDIYLHLAYYLYQIIMILHHHSEEKDSSQYEEWIKFQGSLKVKVGDTDSDEHTSYLFNAL